MLEMIGRNGSKRFNVAYDNENNLHLLEIPERQPEETPVKVHRDSWLARLKYWLQGFIAPTR